MSILTKNVHEIEISQFKMLDFLSSLPTMFWDHQNPFTSKFSK